MAVKMASLKDEQGSLGPLHLATCLDTPELSTNNQYTATSCGMFSQVICCPARFSVSSTAALGPMHAGRRTRTPATVYHNPHTHMTTKRYMINTRILPNTHTHTGTHTHILTHTHTHTNTHNHTAHKHMHTHTHTHTHTGSTHTRTHTRTHTNTHSHRDTLTEHL